MRFNAKVSSIEEMAYLNDLKMDQLHGTLVAYEMRLGVENITSKEAALKQSRKAKEHKDHQDYSKYEYNQEFTQLAKKPKCGLGKYKGKFPFMSFYCGRVGNFSSKFPYKEKV